MIPYGPDQIGKGGFQTRIQVGVHRGELLNQHEAGDNQLIHGAGGFQETREVREHFGEIIGIRLGVLQEIPQGLNAIEKRLLGFEFVEGLLLEGDRLVPYRVAVQLLGDVSEDRIGLELVDDETKSAIAALELD